MEDHQIFNESIKDIFTYYANDSKYLTAINTFYDDDRMLFDYLYIGGFLKKYNFIDLVQIIQLFNIYHILELGNEIDCPSIKTIMDTIKTNDEVTHPDEQHNYRLITRFELLELKKKLV